MREFLKGYRTYLASAVGVGSTLLAYADGQVALVPAITAIAGFLGLSFLRNAIEG